MANPFYGVLINSKYYEYLDGSYKVTIPLKNQSEETQTTRTFSALGRGFDSHSITLVLRNTYSTFSPSTNANLGSTTWLGVSRWVDFRTDIGANGVSLPITFVDPSGITHSVLPIGSIDREIITPIQDAGVEYRINLSFDSVS